MNYLQIAYWVLWLWPVVVDYTGWLLDMYGADVHLSGSVLSISSWWTMSTDSRKYSW